MSKELSDDILFENLDIVKSDIIEKLKKCYIYISNDIVDYKEIIINICLEHTMKNGKELQVMPVIYSYNDLSANILLFGMGVNINFDFDASVWIREYKLNKLL